MSANTWSRRGPVAWVVQIGILITVVGVIPRPAAAAVAVAGAEVLVPSASAPSSAGDGGGLAAFAMGPQPLFKVVGGFDAAAKAGPPTDVAAQAAPPPIPTTTTTTEPPPPPPPPPPPRPAVVAQRGHLAKVKGIVVHESIADDLAALLGAADAAGFDLGGEGYRPIGAQVELRRAHCGDSDEAIYSMSPMQCSPPTARPGTSNHEKGLAVDFTINGSILTKRSAVFGWLRDNAATFGFYNLPAEPWHWSVDGN
jgi:hypothetical protein